MTTGPDSTEYAGLDSYIARQLGEAAAVLTGQVNIQAKLDAVLRTKARGSTAGDAADVIQND
jgi:hypothetical protein